MFFIEWEKQMKIALEKGWRTLGKIGIGLSEKRQI